MTKINIARLFDSGKALATQAGSDLSEFLTFASSAFEIVLRTLKNGVSVEDNMNASVLNVTLKHNTAAFVQVTAPPRHVFPTRLQGVNATSDTQTEPTPRIAWYIDTQSRLVVTPYFQSASTSKTYQVQLVVLY